MRLIKSIQILLVLFTLSATGLMAQIPERRLDDARKLVELKKHSEAIEQYEEIRKWMERDPGLLVEMARVYTYADRHAEAISLFESIKAKHPELAKEFDRELADQYAFMALTNARKLVNRKEYDSALAEYAKIGKLEDRDIGLLIEHARTYSYAKKHDKAIDLFQKALAKQPKTATDLSDELRDQRAFLVLEKARELVKQKKYVQAITEYTSLGDWLNRDPGLIVEHARVYSYANRHDEAITLLETAARLKKDSAEKILAEMDIEGEITQQKGFLLLEGARKLVELNRYEEALIIYARLTDLLKRDPGLLVEHARVNAYANVHVEAIRLFEEAISMSPKLAKTLEKELIDQKMFIRLEEARTLVEREQYSDAIEIYDELTDLLTRDPGLVIEKARVYSYAKRHKEAADLFQTVMTEHEEYTPIFMRELGDMYTWQHFYDRAIDIYRSSLKLNPDNIDTRLSLARALAWSGEVEAAHTEYDDMLAKVPEHVPTLLGKADAYTMEDKLGTANDILDKIQVLEPGNIDAINMRARIMVWQGYHNHGVDLYKELLELYPDNLEALEGLAFGLHWGDRDPEAFDVLERLLHLRPSRTEASKLMARIRNTRRPYVALYGDYRDDSKPRTTTELGIAAGSILSDYLSVDARYGRKSIKEKESENTDLDANILGLLTSWHLTRRVILDLDLAFVDYDQANWQDLFIDGNLLWRPRDVLYLDIGYDTDTVNSIKPIFNKLTKDSISARIKWKPDRMWMFSAKQSAGDYSDSNNSDTTLLVAEYRITQTPYLKCYYNYYKGEWDMTGDGYFSPKDFYAHTIGAYLSKRFSANRFGYVQGWLGREHHGDGINVPNYYLAAGYVYRPNLNWKLKISASYFDSESDADKGHDGYRETHVWASISRSLGSYVAHEHEHDVEPVPVPEAR